MKPHYLLLVALLSSTFAIGQGGLIMKGKLKIEEGKLEGKLELLENGNRVRIANVTGNGKFEQKLDFNKEYIFVFSQDGFVQKKVAVNTNVPDELKEDPYPMLFDMEVTLFKQYEGVNFMVFNQPVGKIKFDTEQGMFDFDTDYSKSIQQRLEEVEKEVEEKKVEEEKMAKESPKEEKPEEKIEPKIEEDMSVKREDPPTARKKLSPPPPPPPKHKVDNVVVLHSYTVGEMGYPDLNAYGFINFGDGGGRREITKEQFDEYAKLYR